MTISAVPTLPPSLVYRLAERTAESSFEQLSSSRQTQRELDDIWARIQSVERVDDVFRDQRLFSWLLEATGIRSQLQTPAIAREALTTDPRDEDHLGRRLQNERLLNASAELELYRGVDRLKRRVCFDELSEQVLRARNERAIAQGMPEISNARYFARNIAGASDNVFEILGDGVLREVVTTTLGLPLELALQEIDTQARAITSRINLEDFQDPKFVESFIQRYLSVVDTQYASANQGSSMLNLFPTQDFSGGQGAGLFAPVNLLV